MKLENQVVSLELAKKLKELGVKQKSLFYYAITKPNDLKPTSLEWYKDIEKVNKVLPNYIEELYSAFTVAELGEMLPGNTSGLYFVTQKGLMGNSWYVDALTVVGHSKVCLTTAETEADARAKMLIHLIENKLITL